jgi:hypothetical protein
MKGKSDFDWLWIILILPWALPMVFGVIFPEIPPSPCTEWDNVTCDEWNEWECNINETVEVVSGPFYDQKTEYIEIYKKRACVEWENGTRVIPR